MADRLIAKYNDGMINDVKNNSFINPGYPEWWLNETGYQYGPRIYQYKELQEVPDLKYVNETAYTEPGDELNYIVKQENTADSWYKKGRELAKNGSYNESIQPYYKASYLLVIFKLIIVDS